MYFLRALHGLTPLADCPTAVLTPHTASSTVENSAEMNIAAVDNVLELSTRNSRRQIPGHQRSSLT